MSTSGLVYELRIPLATNENRPYAVGALAGATIGLGLETPEIDMSAMRDKMKSRRSGDGGTGGSGMRGGGGRGGGGMRDGGGRSRPEMPEPLNVWTKVTLASENLTNLENENQKTAGK